MADRKFSELQQINQLTGTENGYLLYLDSVTKKASNISLNAILENPVSKLSEAVLSQQTGDDITKTMSQKAITDELNKKADASKLSEYIKGTATTSVPSSVSSALDTNFLTEKAVTEALSSKADAEELKKYALSSAVDEINDIIKTLATKSEVSSAIDGLSEKYVSLEKVQELIKESEDKILDNEGLSESLEIIKQITEYLKENEEFDSLLAVIDSKVDKDTFNSKVEELETAIGEITGGGSLSNYLKIEDYNEDKKKFFLSEKVVDSLGSTVSNNEVLGALALKNLLEGKADASALNNYVLSTSLSSTLEGYAKSEELSKFVNTENVVKEFTTNNEGEEFESKVTSVASVAKILKAYPKTTELDIYAKYVDVANTYATKESVLDMATQSWVKEQKYLTIEDLPEGDGGLSDLQIEEKLKNYVKTSDLTSTLEGYVKQQTLDSTLESYVSDSELATELESYAKSSELDKYVEDSELLLYVKTEELTETLENYVSVETYNALKSDYDKLVGRVKALEDKLNKYPELDSINNMDTDSTYGLRGGATITLTEIAAPGESVFTIIPA